MKVNTICQATLTLWSAGIPMFIATAKNFLNFVLAVSLWKTCSRTFTMSPKTWHLMLEAALDKLYVRQQCKAVVIFKDDLEEHERLCGHTYFATVPLDIDVRDFEKLGE
jgi:hypothetical protein